MAIAYSKPGYQVFVNGVRRERIATSPVIPPGGAPGMVLAKKTSADFDIMWMELETIQKGARNENGEFLLNENGTILIND